MEIRKILNSHFYCKTQYKTHNTSDWLGEYSEDSKINGFKWRGGRLPETIGIWMWSEVFTHDFENGEQVAIILLDTQGTFDSRSSITEYTTIFALSTMLSSIQCYNLMHNIQEDDLQNLQFFTEYGQLALEQTQVKPFQYLLFLIRDWQYASEISYGWSGKQFLSETFADNEDLTPEMQQIRKQIQSSFEKIEAFLMPHPGFIVAKGKNFNGNLKLVDSEFLHYVKELVPKLFAPQNLIVKTINGQKIKSRDFVQYLQAYLNVFNDNTLPQPKTIHMVKCSIHRFSLEIIR